MSLFEKLMTATGRRVYHLFFLASALVMCRACAQYFFYAEQNFKCPICEILKSARNPSQVLINYSECLICPNVEPFIKETLGLNKLNKGAFVSSAETIHQQLPFVVTQCYIGNCSQTKVNYNRYLLFSQLKIGNC